MLVNAVAKRPPVAASAEQLLLMQQLYRHIVLLISRLFLDSLNCTEPQGQLGSMFRPGGRGSTASVIHAFQDLWCQL